jgi:hypothetical protein
MGRNHFPESGSKKPGCGRPVRRSGGIAVLASAAIAGFHGSARADEGGGSFWQSGTYDSFAAVPDQPGW